MSTPIEKTGLNICSRNYSFTVTKEDFGLIEDMDNEMPEYADTLGGKLDKIGGVDDADYNGHFGSYIFFRVAAEDDNDEKQDEIFNTIMEYILESRRSGP